MKQVKRNKKRIAAIVVCCVLALAICADHDRGEVFTFSLSE